MQTLDNNTNTKAAKAESTRKEMEIFDIFNAKPTQKQSKSGSPLYVLTLVDCKNRTCKAWVSESQIISQDVTPRLLPKASGMFSFYEKDEEMFNGETCTNGERIVKEF